MAREALIDVLGLGAIAIDELLYVDACPTPDAKVHVRDRRRAFGGQTGTALVAAARMGAKAAYAGSLGTDPESDSALNGMWSEGIAIEHCKRVEGCGPILSTIVVGDGGRTRAILADTRKFRGADPDWPPPGTIRASKVLFVDHWGVDGMLRAARIARESGVPIVADFERNSSPRFAELLALTDHLIVGRSFAGQLTGEGDPAEAVKRLRRGPHAVVIVTDGGDGCWVAGTNDESPRHVPAFPVRVRDTTGCGDVFHGVYAAALARGEPLMDRILAASAAAAIKAERPGGQEGIPDRETVSNFLGFVKHR